ncbi:MAG: rpsH [Candidatus Nomurabacteria bacterium]|nr:rpsH [Candidatus Nomurabacteria bacterium]
MDQIANMLTSIKNAGLVKKATVTIPSSKMKVAILELLKQEGYVKTYHVTDSAKPEVEIVLEYKKDEPKVKGVKRISKQSKRVYTGVKDITQVKYGFGMSVLSTPKGILSDKQARKELVGGEVLFTIW